MTAAQRQAVAALAADGQEASPGKGGFFVKGQGWVSARIVYARYGIRTERQTRGRISAYGDFATIQMLNTPRREGK